MKIKCSDMTAGERNQWMKMVGHRGCIYPCSGHPVMKHKPGQVRVGADDLPAFLQCSECGYTPDTKKQPGLVKRFLEFTINKDNQTII